MVVISLLGLANQFCASLRGNYRAGEELLNALAPDPLDRWDTQKQKLSAYGNGSAEQPGGGLAVAQEIGRKPSLLRQSPLNTGHRESSLKVEHQLPGRSKLPCRDLMRNMG